MSDLPESLVSLRKLIDFARGEDQAKVAAGNPDPLKATVTISLDLAYGLLDAGENLLRLEKALQAKRDADHLIDKILPRHPRTR